VGELLTLVKKHLLPNRRDPMETSKGGIYSHSQY
jgi:hypothetical protein